MEVSTTIPVRNLLDLPDEILLNVFEKLKEDQPWNGDVLSNFRQTCRKLYNWAGPIKYDHIRIGTEAEHDRLISYLKADRRRENLVENLVFAPEEQIITEDDYDDDRDEDEVDATDNDADQDADHNTDRLTDLDTPQHPFHDKEFDMSLLAFRFKNLKHLEFRTDVFNVVECDLWDYQVWVEAWDFGVVTSSFAKLTECYLRNDPDWGESNDPLQLTPLLRAPKLQSLTLEGLDLRECVRDFIPDHSTSLKNLKIRRCLVDEQSVSVILSKPSALVSLDFGEVWTRERSATYRYRKEWYLPNEELSILRMMLRAIAESQPFLTALRFTLENRGLSDDDAFKGMLDFTQLENLKVLHVKKSDWTKIHAKYHEWCPFNLFVKLPDGIETIRLRARTGDVNMAKLADRLLDLEECPGGLPNSLRRLSVITRCHSENHERPLTAWHQFAEDNLRSDISRLIRESSLSQLDFIQCNWYVNRNDSNLYDTDSLNYWIREFKATSTSGNAQLSDAEENTYDLEEVTWVQDRVTERQQRKTNEFEKKTWGPERWGLTLKTKDTSRRTVSTSLLTGLKFDPDMIQSKNVYESGF